MISLKKLLWFTLTGFSVSWKIFSTKDLSRSLFFLGRSFPSKQRTWSWIFQKTTVFSRQRKDTSLFFIYGELRYLLVHGYEIFQFSEERFPLVAGRSQPAPWRWARSGWCLWWRWLLWEVDCTRSGGCLCQAEGWAKKMFKMMWYDRWRLWWISLKMLITLRKAARCPKWRSQLHWEPQVPPKENLCESKYHFFLVMIFYNFNYSDFFEDLHLTWNLQRRSPSTTRNATAAREANKMNKVCSSIPGVEV